MDIKEHSTRGPIDSLEQVADILREQIQRQQAILASIESARVKLEQGETVDNDPALLRYLSAVIGGQHMTRADAEDRVKYGVNYRRAANFSGPDDIRGDSAYHLLADGLYFVTTHGQNGESYSLRGSFTVKPKRT